jgi:hypothetical protein
MNESVRSNGGMVMEGKISRKRDVVISRMEKTAW